MADSHSFSGPVTVFHERPLPERATPAGYAALIGAFGLKVPLPATLCATGEHHRIRKEAGWRILTPRHAPSPDLDGHLTFALKYEGLDLAILKRLFGVTGRATGEAGRRPIDLDELLRLQKIVIGDARFVRMGLRLEDGFVGEHDRDTRMPIPDHISARPEDLRFLIQGLAAFDRGAARSLDGVIAAAILERIDQYRAVLEDYSRRLLPVIEWEPTADGNVRVLNDTTDFYGYFDATPQAEFLYTCVRKTIEEELPREAGFLVRYDQFRAHIEAIADMPDRTVDLLFRFLLQDGGRLSRRVRQGEFAKLTDAEAATVEQAYASLFRADGL
jgi:hypothetical protein